MTWLTADDVADRLGIARRTAMSLMHQMPHSVIGGTQRKRIRVSEETFDQWMAKQTVGKPISTIKTGTNKKLQRR